MERAKGRRVMMTNSYGWRAESEAEMREERDGWSRRKWRRIARRKKKMAGGKKKRGAGKEI